MLDNQAQIASSGAKEPTASMGYDPAALEPGVVHIGLGGFARGFLLDYLHEIAQKGNKEWGVIGIRPHTAHTPDLDDEKSWPYMLATGDDPADRHMVGVIRGIMGGKDRADDVVHQLAAPSTKVVTLTITAGGYCLNDNVPDMHRLESDVVAIQKGDLKNIHTAPGLLVASLFERYNHGELPPTILALDNVRNNGDATKRVVRAMAEEISQEFGDYAATVICPNTTVDRIVPPCPIDRPLHALADVPGPSIQTEKYRKFSIEATFPPGSIPPFQTVGAHLVADIRDAEDLKLRLVNGGHLALAVVAKALGIEKVHHAVDGEKNPSLRHFLEEFLGQAGHAILLPNVDVGHEVDQILKRYEANKTDEVDRLVKDTHTKVVPRLFNDHALRHGKDTDASAFAIGAWLHYFSCGKNGDYALKGDDHKAKPIESVEDLRRHLSGAGHIPHDTLHEFCQRAFGYYEMIKERGMATVLKGFFPGRNPLPGANDSSQTPELA